MKLGFVSAILGDLTFDEVIRFAADTGYQCVEVMCWPTGAAERRYAGVTHVDAVGFTEQNSKSVQSTLDEHGIEISGLGYYPNPLTDEPGESTVYIDHLKRVIDAAAMLNVNLVNTFVGREPAKSVDDNFEKFMNVWPAIIEYADAAQVRIGIENCPMYFTEDEWPGGKNLAATPAIWKRMFESIPSENFGLNYDPSHLVWQFMDYCRPLQVFRERLFHIHAKDVRIDRDKLNEVGVMAPPNQWHAPKLPGLGDVNWGDFFSALTGAGYNGPVCVEVEDRAYEGSLENRKSALRQSHNYLRQFIARNS